MKLYYARHGETDWNALNKVLGVTDIPLNENGRAQARALAEQCARLGDIDVILSSPLIRCQETADIVSSYIMKPVITDNRLTEWNYGKYEGVDRLGTYDPARPSFQNAKMGFCERVGETGESLLKLAHRVYAALDELPCLYAGQNPLLVTHGGVCRVLETYYKNMTAVEFSQYFADNCELRLWII
ncbi:MAG: histidine phosphatase family protein [Oscillospiraceae bacterium]|nr:histidine phosphatase family protein [Oscillospiraceae bacterium]